MELLKEWTEHLPDRIASEPLCLLVMFVVHKEVFSLEFGPL